MYSIGIDIGGMSVKVGVVEKGEIFAIRTIPTSSSTEYNDFLSQVTGTLEELIEDAREKELDMIGISSCGLIDSKAGKITYSNNIKWEDKSIVTDIKKRFAVPVRIANDAKCALLAEAVLGAGKEYDRVCMITLGTGVGGGFLTGKKLDSGTPYADASGILGHMTVVTDGKECTCGHHGCLEAYASASALMAAYKEETGQDITAKDIFDRVRGEEPAAIKVFGSFKKYLGDGLISFGNILRPEVIVLGGGVASSADLFLDYLEEYVNKGIFGRKALPIKITAAMLGNAAGMIGATLL